MARQPPSQFQPARDAFHRLAAALRDEPGALREIESSLVELVKQFSTTIYENRFLVGGAIEVIFIAAMRFAGLKVDDVGAENTRADFIVDGVAPFSVKSHLRGRPSSFRLINVLGSSSDAAWSEATIFVVHGRGFGYADPDLLPGVTRRAADAVLLPCGAVFNLWRDQPELHVPCAVPRSDTPSNQSRLASRLVANEILRSKRLLRPVE